MIFTPSRFTLLRLLACVVLSAGPIANAQSDEAATEKLRYFETHIRPLLHAKCVKCHGENQQKGNLRLDSREGLVSGGESGTSIVPGKPAESLLLEAVRYESFEMPPDKPLSEEEISHLEQWLADGAVWPVSNGQSVRLSGAVFTEEERNFWSLQPLSRPDVPELSRESDPGEWGHNAIDRFVGAKLETAGIAPAPRADQAVLIRRLYFDVLGVPPSPDEIQQLTDEMTPSRWAELIDRLLADTRYGEHWARYWLDVVRYAESDGFRADFYRPDAWRYRDYVVNAFNNDKPYDQFVMEQLAGDEISPDKAESLVATGFLRTYLYEYNQRDARTQWQDILNQVTDVTGEVFLGMGVGCARCHDHKFDPILQEDYFRLQACFGTMIPRDDVPAADLEDRQRYSREYEDWLAKATELREELASIRDPYLERASVGAIKRFPEDVQAVMAKSPEQRSPLDAQLADLVYRQVLFDQDRMKIKDEDKKRIEELEKQIEELAGREPARLPSAITVADVQPEPQLVHLAANPKRKTVQAGGFSILNPAPFNAVPTATSTGQRTALAQWIASPQHPLTARVIVNRIWQRHFGTGLVDNASDFGSLGGTPSHPELLDWLASEFIAHDWSIKWLHRQILNSATWQMSSFHPQAAAAETVDPRNRLRWRFAVRRLNAEQIRDAMLIVSGELQSEQGGPSVEFSSLRRSLYLKAIRNSPEPLLSSLDGVDGLNSIPKRSTTTTPTQALNLMNGEWVRSRASRMAKRVLEEFNGTDPTGIVDYSFQLALARSVGSDEVPVAVKMIHDSMSRSPDPADFFRSLSEDTGAAIHVGDNGLPPLATKTQQPSITAPFTFVGVVELNSLYPDATVRTIVSQWDSSNSHQGWAIGVTSEKSAYQPRNLILQVVGEKGYEVVASNLRPELDTPYLVGVSVRQTEDGKGMATFCLQPLGSDSEKLQTADVEFKSAAGITGRFPLMVGGRSKQSRHKWDGQLDQLALFSRSLSAQEIAALFKVRLKSSALADHSPVAAWDFEDSENRTADTSGDAFHLQVPDDAGLNLMEQAVADLCHVLLNSNEFVYID